MSGSTAVLKWLGRTVFFMEVWPTFDPDPSFDNIKVKTIPSCQSCNTRSRKLAQWVKVEPSDTDNENSKKAGNNGVCQDFSVGQA